MLSKRNHCEYRPKGYWQQQDMIRYLFKANKPGKQTEDRVLKTAQLFLKVEN